MRTGLIAGAALVALASTASAAPVPAPARIDPAALSATVKVLASEGFGGRAPGTPGEARTVDYLVGRFKALGLKPADPGGSWTQAVPLVRTQLGAPVAITVEGAGAAMTWAQAREAYVSTVRPVDALRIAGAPMVFVGYGVHAPERGWDDFKGVDLRGKLAVVLVNDPDFAAAPGEPVAGKFGGKAMTYYGRWTYKYEELARRGAVGALIVHDAPAAGYGWSTVIAPQGEAYDVVRDPSAPQPLLVQGWLQHDAAAALFRGAGLDLTALETRARRADFAPMPLGAARFSLSAPVTHARVESHNVLAELPGLGAPGETVMYGAHWDAYGIGAPDAQGRTLRPGANDDGLGVAGVLEIARAFSQGPRPRRTVMFGLWTAEERGLLGSEWYAAHPTRPLATTAADLTMDILQTAGPSRDVVLVGSGQDSLEDDLARAAAAQGRTVTPDSHPERGLFYRADHFSLAKRGVPTLLLMGIGGGPDLVAGGRAAGDAWVAHYTAEQYHKPGDAWSAAWDLRGAAQDVALLYELGSRLAETSVWPSWTPSSEFRAIREATGALR